MTLEGGEVAVVAAAARLWRAGSWRQQRGFGGRGGDGSAALELGRGVGRRAVLEGREEAVSRRDTFAIF